MHCSRGDDDCSRMLDACDPHILCNGTTGNLCIYIGKRKKNAIEEDRYAPCSADSEVRSRDSFWSTCLEDLLAVGPDAQTYACNGIIGRISYSYADYNGAQGWDCVFTRPDRTRPHYPDSSTMMTP